MSRRADLTGILAFSDFFAFFFTFVRGRNDNKEGKRPIVYRLIYKRRQSSKR